MKKALIVVAAVSSLLAGYTWASAKVASEPSASSASSQTQDNGNAGATMQNDSTGQNPAQ